MSKEKCRLMTSVRCAPGMYKSTHIINTGELVSVFIDDLYRNPFKPVKKKL